MKETLSVAAIENGTVIDHITAGQGMRIVRFLQLDRHCHLVTLGLNLPSKCMKYKDLIKVAGREITEEEANQIAVFAPKATINIIRKYQLVQKFSVSLPTCIERMLACPNERCITNHESMHTAFHVHKLTSAVQLTCKYCSKSFAHDTF